MLTIAQTKRLMKQNAVTGASRGGGRLYVNNVGEDAWWTDTYVAVKCAGRTDPVAALLRHYNLDPAAPATYSVNGAGAGVQQGVFLIDTD